MYSYSTGRVDITASVYKDVLVFAISFNLLTKLVDVVALLNTSYATASALSTTVVAELELNGLAIKVNGYITSLHSAIGIFVICVAEVVQIGVCGVVTSIYAIQEVIQIVSVHIVIVNFDNVLAVHLKCAETFQHCATLLTVIRPEAIVFAFDLLDLTSYQTLFTAIVVVPTSILVLNTINRCEALGIQLFEGSILVRANYLEPALNYLSTILWAVEVRPVRCGMQVAGGILSRIPLIYHYTTGIEVIVFTIVLPGSISILTAIVKLYTFLTVCFEVEPVIIVIFFVIGVVVYADLLPASLHGTIFPGTEVVGSVCPTIFVVNHGTIFVNPTVQHDTILIECVLLSIDGLLAYFVTAALVCFTIGLHVVVMILSRIILIILILVNYFNPGVGNHNTVSVYVVGLIVILNQFIGSHCATLFGIQPEPVVSRFLPLIFYSATIFVVVVPGTIFLNPTLSCERSHSTTDS